MKTSKHTTVIAITALVIAVFGATPLGHAAGKLMLPKGSVGSAQLKASAVTGKKVKDGSLYAADFAAGQIPAGAKGDKGDKGDPGLSGYQVVAGSPIALNPGQAGTVTATCPAGKKALGGSWTTTNYLLRVGETSPTGSLDGWAVTARNDAAVQAMFNVRAVCAYVG
jgi:hypothetical protein